MCGAYTYFLSIFFLTLLSYILFIRYKKPWLRPRLPPGSMGWPHIGETLQLYSQDPNLFFTKKQKRYGEIFKTHILGCPSVMVASPEAAKFVLATQSHLFKPTYPKSKETLIGPSALFFHQGDYHMKLRKLVQASLSPESVRALVPNVEAIAVCTLDSWAGGQVINTFREMKKFVFEVGILAVFGHLDGEYRRELKKNYCQVENGYNSFPTKIPGTAYKKALQARQKLTEIIREIMDERKEKRMEEKNLLDHLLNSKDEGGKVLTEDQIADNVIGVLFAAQDTTASVLTWIIKYLHDNPKLLEAVKDEQKAIYESNNEGERQLTWSQTRKMTLTHKFNFLRCFFGHQVVLESYVIPKGWKVLPLFRNIHHNPEFFQDPHKFDPSRFEAAPIPNTFVPFGSGLHACPGNELARLEMFVMIHHLVTKFRWELVGSQSGIQYSPFPVYQPDFGENPASKGSKQWVLPSYKFYPTPMNDFYFLNLNICARLKSAKFNLLSWQGRERGTVCIMRSVSAHFKQSRRAFNALKKIKCNSRHKTHADHVVNSIKVGGPETTYENHRGLKSCSTDFSGYQTRKRLQFNSDRWPLVSPQESSHVNHSVYLNQSDLLKASNPRWLKANAQLQFDAKLTLCFKKITGAPSSPDPLQSFENPCSIYLQLPHEVRKKSTTTNAFVTLAFSKILVNSSSVLNSFTHSTGQRSSSSSDTSPTPRMSSSAALAAT
ncbi:hypothetical protein V2J09_011772 [Rumex salicifolius]